MEAQAHADAWLAADWVLAGSVVFRGRRTYVNGMVGGPFSLNDSLRRMILKEILEEIAPPRKYRSNPRVVKRKMSKFPVKRQCHRRASTVPAPRPAPRMS